MCLAEKGAISAETFLGGLLNKRVRRKMIELCPKCLGQGTVSMPLYIDGDVHTWIDNVCGGYTCKVCGGKGYVKC